MKFTTVLAFIAAATVVSASTNAERFARGMPPNKPVKRTGPHRPHPSSNPGNYCSGGTTHCCDSRQVAHSGDTCDDILKAYGLFGSVAPGTGVGMNCSPISILGVGGNTCSRQTLCCEDNKFNGLINLGCNEINL